jgi:hypothetical protein
MPSINSRQAILAGCYFVVPGKHKTALSRRRTAELVRPPDQFGPFFWSRELRLEPRDRAGVLIPNRSTARAQFWSSSSSPNHVPAPMSSFGSENGEALQFFRQ